MQKFILPFLITLMFSGFTYADGNNSESTSSKWAFYANLAKKIPTMAVFTNKNSNSFVKNDEVRLSLDVTERGYLNVFSIDEDDKMTVLFPNRFHNNNEVLAEKFVFPTSEMRFKLKAQAPFGKSLIVAFLTKKDLDLHQRYPGIRKNTNETQIFRQLSAEETDYLDKSIGVFANFPEPANPRPHVIKPTKAKDMKMGLVKVFTCETAESC